MQKTYYRFLCFELMERLARFGGLLNDLEDIPQPIVNALQLQLQTTQAEVLKSRELLMNLLTEASPSGKTNSMENTLQALFSKTFQTLSQLTRVLIAAGVREIQPETHLFLKDALPEELTCKTGEYTVLLDSESPSSLRDALHSLIGSPLQVAGLPVLQKNNPLGWLGLAEPVCQYFSAHEPVFNTIKKTLYPQQPETAQLVIRHALALRLFGPAYYFHATADAILTQDKTYLSAVEPALFYGLRHLNFCHNHLVILHESLDTKPEPAITDATYAELYKAVEKTIPDRLAFTAKHFERASALKARLDEGEGQGVLLSSTAVFSQADLGKALEKEPVAIYDILGMATEYPHTPREIVNAGWLHKTDRSGVWLFAALQEAEPFTKLADLLGRQDHLLSKSIETSEVHRVLLCTP